MEKLKKLYKKELPFLFLGPAILWQVLFLYIPFLVLLVSSFYKYFPKVGYVLTLSHYKAIFAPFSLKFFFNSFMLALETSAISFLIAYPLAYFLAFKVKRLRTFFLILVILPSWTSLIIQIYAWFFLLKKDGMISQALYNLGFFHRPLHMLNNHFAMIVGMVYCYMPFMVLPIYAVLEKIDKRVLEASSDLGASRWTTIKKVILPLSFSGIIAGLFLVFIPAFGEFAIPEFLGGSKKLFWGNVIVHKFLYHRSWGSGAAITYSGLLFPVIVVLFGYLVYSILRRLLSALRGKNNG